MFKNKAVCVYVCVLRGISVCYALCVLTIINRIGVTKYMLCKVCVNG